MAGFPTITLGFVFALGFLHANATGNSLFAESNPCRLVPNGINISNRNVSCRAYLHCENNAINSSDECKEGYHFDLKTGECAPESLGICNFCKGQHDGAFVKDPASCSHYYFCEGGKGTLGTCPSGLYFNEKTQSCDDTVKCSAPPTLQDPYCRGIPDGVWITYPGDCQKSIMCSNQKAFAEKCPAGKLWSATVGECKLANTVLCTKCRGIEGKYFVQDRNDNTCRAYYLCIDEEVNRRGKCEEDKIFDEGKQKCIDKVGGKCTDPCDGKEDYYKLQDRNDCEQYINCLGGKKESPKKCPKSGSVQFQFNEEKQLCDYPGSFECL